MTDSPWAKNAGRSLYAEVPPARCPSCGSLNAAATAVELNGATPKPGDIAICFTCAELLQYGDQLGLVRLEGEERALALAHPLIKAGLRALFEIRHPAASPWSIHPATHDRGATEK